MRNTPLAEAVIAGTAAGAAAMGLRPVIDLLYAPFLTLSMDAIINSAGKLRYLSGGQFAPSRWWCWPAPAPAGRGRAAQPQPGGDVRACAGAEGGDALERGRLQGPAQSALHDDNPVMFFMDMTLGHTPGAVPAGEHVVPLGRAAAVLRSGRDVTLVSYSKTVGHCLTAAQELAELGVDAEVIDLRTLAARRSNPPALGAQAAGWWWCTRRRRPAAWAPRSPRWCRSRPSEALKSPVRRLTGPDAPAPSSWVLEQAGVPPEAIVRTAAGLMLCDEVSA